MIKNIFNMGYRAGHCDEVRSRIASSARRLFNLHGFEGVTIDQIMADAGLTRGAFYFHFRSKAELYRAAIEHVLADHPSAKWMRADDPRPLKDRIIEAYLGPQHLAQTEDSCPLVTLASESSRQGPEVQATMRSVLQALIGALGADCDRDRAIALACLCVGGISIARAVDDPALAEEIRESALRAATALQS